MCHPHQRCNPEFATWYRIAGNGVSNTKKLGAKAPTADETIGEVRYSRYRVHSIEMNTELNAIYCNRCGTKSARDAQFCQSCGESFRTTVPTSVPRLAAQSSHANASVSAPTLTVRYAGFSIRVVASFVDLCVVFVGFLPVRMLLGSTATLLGVSSQMPTARIIFLSRVVRIGCAVLLGWFYRAGMESSGSKAPWESWRCGSGSPT